MIAKLLNLVKVYQSDIVLGISIIFITIISFNLGKIVAFDSLKTPLTINQPQNLALGKPDNDLSATPLPTKKVSIDKHAKQKLTDQVFASKSSKSKLFHYSWCTGYAKIAEHNRLTFLNATAAISAGYSLAGNCK